MKLSHLKPKVFLAPESNLSMPLHPVDTQRQGQGIQGLEKKDRASFTSSLGCARKIVEAPKSYEQARGLLLMCNGSKSEGENRFRR